MLVILPKDNHNITDVEFFMRRFETRYIEKKLSDQSQFAEVEVQGPML